MGTMAKSTVGVAPRMSVIGFIKNAIAVKKQRNSLYQMSDRMLDDLGITRAEADREARRSIWDAPGYWRK